MLYQKICVVAVNVYVFLSSKVQSSTYLVSTAPSASYSCPSNETDCHIYCDESEHSDSNTYNCNNAVNCHFHCDQKQCASQSIVNASDASNLYVTEASSGESCFSGATITTPNDGNAYFDTHAKKGFNSLTVHAGTNAHQIIVNTTFAREGGIGSDMSNLEVYAANADYFEFVMGDGLEMKDSSFYCPVDSSYVGPQPAPCIIDAADAKKMDVDIIAPYGFPINVYITGCNDCTVTCSHVDTVNGDKSDTSTSPFDESSDCWWISRMPTTDPTVPPTRQPTSSTIQPSSAPSHAPSSAPSHAPSTIPSNAPTTSPTGAPSLHPSTAPTSAPSKSPTIPPTNAPSISPSIAPSNSPTIPPSNAPSISPSNAPTDLRLVVDQTNDPTQTSESSTLGNDEQHDNPNNVMGIMGFMGDGVLILLLLIIGLLIVIIIGVSMCFMRHRRQWNTEKDNTFLSSGVQKGEAKKRDDSVQSVDEASQTDGNQGEVRIEMGANVGTHDVGPALPPSMAPPPAPFHVSTGAVVMRLPQHHRTIGEEEEKEESDTDTDSTADLYGQQEPIEHTKGGSIMNEVDKAELLRIAMSHMQAPDVAIVRKKSNEMDKYVQAMTMKNEEVGKVQLWMENVVHLGEYTELLIKNGYDEMEAIMEITMEDMVDIGIKKMGHRRKILRYAAKYHGRRHVG
eukprot:189719_1